MLNWLEVSKVMKQGGFNKQIFDSPLRIAMGMLKSENSLHDIVKRGLTEDYAKKVVDIWKPQEEGSTRTKVMERLPGLLESIASGLHDLSSPAVSTPKPATYEILLPKFREIDKIFRKAIDRKVKEALLYANPYLTVTIKNSYNQGREFQIAAKGTSSVETGWGTWIEKVLPMFNSTLELVFAGGFDCILKNVAYDIKSGPKIANKGMVHGFKIKRDVIKNLSQSEGYKNIIKVNDFKVAIVYGKESIANTYMKGQAGLIIFGKDTWNELTGDEWNAYRLFLWQVRYQIQEKQAQWSQTDLREAVEHYVTSFYDRPEELRTALEHDDYKDLSSFL